MTHSAAIGFRAHSGWAAMVAVGGPPAAPLVLKRQRVQLADREIAGSAQLYHSAAEMSLDDAAAYVWQCTEASAGMAQTALRLAVADLTGRGYRFAGACVLQASGRPLGPLEKILASHPLIHTAEGQFYRDALTSACRTCQLKAAALAERGLLDRAAAMLGLSADTLQQHLAELGKMVGPPWRQDEKFSALAAWTCLAHTSLKTAASLRTRNRADSRRS